MAKLLCLPFLFFFFLLTNTTYAQSQIVINEILPTPSSGADWVELYNPTAVDVDLSDWILDDEGTSTNMLQIANGEIITKNSFKLFHVSNRLNKAGDTVFLRNSDGEVDRFEYKSTELDVSYGRFPDGGSDWGTCVPTPEAKNANCQIEVESENEEDSQAQSSPNESSGNSSTNSPSPTAKATTNLSSPRVLAQKKHIASPKILTTSSPSASPDLEEDSASSSSVKTATFLTGAGAILIGASVLFYFWYYKMRGKTNKQIEEPTTEEKE